MDQQQMIDKLVQRHEDLQSMELTSLELAFALMSAIQEDVSKPVPNAIPEPGIPPTKDAVRTYFLAMMVETGELLQTLDWKPWKNKSSIDREKVIDEFADILAFQGIIINYLRRLGITPADLAEGYRKKSLVNIERFLGQHGVEYKQESLYKE